MSIYTFTLQDAHQQAVSLADYQGKVLLIVNTATRCGLTPQYEELQQLYARYQEQGLEILDFPCNQFREQAPDSSEEIVQVCQTKFGTKFKIFDKIDITYELDLSTPGSHLMTFQLYLERMFRRDYSLG